MMSAQVEGVCGCGDGSPPPSGGPSAPSPPCLAGVVAAAALLVELTLSFAGLGVDGTGLSLGTMLRDGQQLAQVRPLLVVAPGAVAVLTILALLVAASGLREGRDAAA
jgi:ABC-type dipeptide/oligopeptide/nickel transport system permease subunit